MKEVFASFAAKCGGVETALIDCGDDVNGIWGILAMVLNVMIALVGVLGIAGIIIAGIQYITAAGDPAAMTKAKRRIIEVIIGLVSFGLMWTFLQWLIPGGILHS
ncbi:hypothetical protein IKE71_02855 [Candidatus Saccharibacteria bacterium]|nr:hypothetical protein [Candidatus Saccharibacteria bacterium]